LVSLQTDNFLLFLLNKRTTTNFRLHEEKMENGFRKIAWASVFRSISSYNFRVPQYFN
jgi:hypothetical protein